MILPTRKIQLLKFTKEVPTYWEKLDRQTEPAANPIGVVSNTRLTEYYKDPSVAWPHPSELDTIPWLESWDCIPKEEAESLVGIQFDAIPNTTEREKALKNLEKLGGLGYLGLATNSSLYYSTSKRNSYTPAIYPKISSHPKYFVGWTANLCDPDTVIPLQAVFAKDDCYALQDAKTVKGLQVNLPITDEEADINQILNVLKDDRYVMVTHDDWYMAISFKIVGKLTKGEWKKWNQYPLPGTNGKIDYSQTIPIEDKLGFELKTEQLSKITPSWANKGHYYIPVAQVITKHKNLIPHREKTGKVSIFESSWVYNERAAYFSINSSDWPESLQVSESRWNGTTFFFKETDILTWPEEPTVGVKSIDYSCDKCLICRVPPDPNTYKIVSERHSGAMAYYYPTASGVKKVHAVSTSTLAQEESIKEELKAMFGNKFEEHLEPYLGDFQNKRLEAKLDYLNAAKFIKNNQVCLAPNYLEVKSSFPEYEIIKLEDAYKALKNLTFQNAVSAGMYEVVPMVYTYFNICETKEQKEKALEVINKLCPDTGSILSRFQAC